MMFDSKPHNRVDVFLSCSVCTHRMSKHDFTFTEDTKSYGPVDRFRCTMKGCSCGIQYMPRVYKMKDGETQEQFMERITAPR